MNTTCIPSRKELDVMGQLTKESKQAKSQLSGWNDWQWQMRNRISTVKELRKYLNLSAREQSQISAAGEKYRWAVTPYYASLMDPDNPNCPLRRQQIPSTEELEDQHGMPDPLSERDQSPVDSIVHVYPDRVAFKITNICPTYCRYCFREYFVGNENEHHTRKKIEQGLQYIARTPAIRDVLITGGDPFLFSDQRLESLLNQLRSISHVEIIRFGTRTLCTLPQRITGTLCDIIARNHPIWINTHFNHPRELTKEVARACELLSKSGVPLGNQTVLLRGVNDNKNTMKELVHGLLRLRIRPYYIFQCQLLYGTAHLRTSIEKGLEIMSALRGHTTGFGVPTYVLDTPYGKVPLAPQYLIGRAGDDVIVKTYDGKLWREPNPLYDEQTTNSLPMLDDNIVQSSFTPQQPFQKNITVKE